MEAECRGVLETADGAGRADLLHLDVMDGHFVPNLTMGPDMCRALRRVLPGVFLDVHLMVTDPGLFVGPFVDAGADHLTFHAEPFAAGNGAWRTEEVVRLAERIREQGISAGLAINPPTAMDGVLELIEAGRFEMVLVMSVNPGRSGQSFIENTLAKTRLISEVLEPTQRLEMDGGIGEGNAGAVAEAGCDVLVASSAIFGRARSERGGVIRRLRGA